MRDKSLIVLGLLVFLVLITFPVWWDMAAKTSSAGPNPELPKGKKTCVAPAELMRTSHMAILNAWRNEVVRGNNRRYTAYDGTVYDMSLTRTCLEKCHTDKKAFCDRCHDYAGIHPYCWDCHVDPALAHRSGQ